jgi:hypothetical protein
VWGELRAEPTSDLSSYRVRRDDLLKYAGLPAPAPCCGGSLLKTLAAVAVIGAATLAVFGTSGIRTRCCGPAAVVTPAPAEDLTKVSDAELLERERNAKDEAALKRIRAEKARRFH